MTTATVADHETSDDFDIAALFARLGTAAACYVIAGPQTAGDTPRTFAAVRVTTDTVVRIADESIVLRRFGAIVQSPEGQLSVVQPDEFRWAYVRALSDGAQIVDQEQGLVEQLRALSKANAEISQKLITVANAKGARHLLRWRQARQEQRQLSRCTDDVSAHIRDLRRMGAAVAVRLPLQA